MDYYGFLKSISVFKMGKMFSLRYQRGFIVFQNAGIPRLLLFISDTLFHARESNGPFILLSFIIKVDMVISFTLSLV